MFCEINLNYFTDVDQAMPTLTNECVTSPPPFFLKKISTLFQVTIQSNPLRFLFAIYDIIFLASLIQIVDVGIKGGKIGEISGVRWHRVGVS